MHKKFRIPFSFSRSDIRKSKIQNLKWLGLSVIAFVLVVTGAVAQAQQAGKIFRIGFLDPSTAASIAGLLEAFRQEMSKLGWIEGKNITIEYRFAEQKRDRMPELAAELVRLKVDLIVVTGVQSALAAMKATTAIPVVIASAPDPVGRGLVASLARPGGNVTGLSSLTPELNTKRLEILKDVVPKLARVGLLWQPARVAGGGERSGSVAQLKELRAAAQVLKLNLEEITTRIGGDGGVSGGIRY